MQKPNFLFIALVLTGISLVGIGSTFDEKQLAQILISIGAGILGASLSNLFGILNGKNVLNIIANSINNDFSTPEKIIENYRKKYYKYWITEYDQKKIWRCGEFDFRKTVSLGKLVATIETITPDLKKIKYQAKGAIRGERLILIQNPEFGNEPPVVSLFPTFAIEHQSIVLGIEIFQSFDRNEICSSAIISQTPINNWKKVGNVDEKTAEVLTTYWERNKIKILEVD